LGHSLTADYELYDGQHSIVEWAAGMFLLFNSEKFRSIGGFDTRYFMYLEDADICRRLNFAGFPTIVVPEITVIHDARRATGRSLQHFHWHLSSLLRFLFMVNPSNQLPPLTKKN
jgi:GT2 family glycosyltransferase